MYSSDPPVRHVRSLGDRAPTVFAHFFDLHFLKEKGADHFHAQARTEMSLATRFALLLADELLIPASSYYESKLCQSVFVEYSPDVYSNHIFLVGGGASIEEFSEDKLRQYRPGEAQWEAYRTHSEHVPFPWRTRFRSSTKDISVEWTDRVEREGLDGFRRSILDEVPKDIERRLIEVPERLDGHAFIVPNLAKIIFDTADISLTAENGLHSILNPAYFRSYISELGASVIHELNYLGSPEPVPSGDPEHDLYFRSLVNACRESGVLHDVTTVPTSHLLDLRSDERFVGAAVQAKISSTQATHALAAFSNVRHVAPKRWHLGSTAKVEQKCKVLVVTALPEEQAAVLAVCDETVNTGSFNDGNVYTVGYFHRGNKPSRQVFVVGSSAMGKVNAATVTTNALRSFPDVAHVILVGIAGGCPNPQRPEDHVRLGDIVVSNSKGILEYDQIKLFKDSVERRGTAARPSYAMLQVFNALEAQKHLGERPWEAFADDALERLRESENDFGRPDESTDLLYVGESAVAHPIDERRRHGRPRVHGGGIGTADILLKDPALRDELNSEYGVKAVEMEGTGVDGAAWSLNKDIFVIRGISDYCDPHKSDTWRYYSALMAASYARAMIERLPDEWFD